MAQLLFSLRNVPDDEAHDVRELLSESAIDFYETPPGNWGISMPALWLSNPIQRELATFLIQEYQEQRMLVQRLRYRQLTARGEAPTLLENLRKNPWLLVFSLAAVTGICYLSVKLVIDLT